MPPRELLFKSKRRRAPTTAAAAVLIASVIVAALSCQSTVGFSPLPTLFHRQNLEHTSSSSVHSIVLYQSSQHQDESNNEAEDTAIASSNNNNNNKMDVSGVTLKMAFDKHWAVADDAETKSERFTSPSSLDLVHRLRRDSDCVLVGRTTVERDNCTLTVRRIPLYPNQQQQPVRIVIDSNLSLLKRKEKYAMFHDGLETIVYCSQESIMNDDTEKSNQDFLTWNEDEAVTFVPLPTDNNNYLSISDILHDVNLNQDIHHVMVEGGPATALLFLNEKLVDRAILIRAPVTFIKPVASNISTEILQEAGLELLGTTTSDGDVVEYWSRPELPWPTENLKDWP